MNSRSDPKLLQQPNVLKALTESSEKNSIPTRLASRAIQVSLSSTEEKREPVKRCHSLPNIPRPQSPLRQVLWSANFKYGETPLANTKIDEEDTMENEASSSANSLS